MKLDIQASASGLWLCVNDALEEIDNMKMNKGDRESLRDILETAVFDLNLLLSDLNRVGLYAPDPFGCKMLGIDAPEIAYEDSTAKA